MASKEEHELSRRGAEDGDAGIPNLAFQPDESKEEPSKTANNNNADFNRTSPKYNYKQFLPFATRNPSKPKIDDSGFLSLMFMSWASETVIKGFKRPLQSEDLDILSPHETMEYNGQRIKRLWDAEVDKVGLENASLGKVVWRAVRTRLIFGVIMFGLSQLFTFLGPALFIRYILEYLEKKEYSSIGYGIALVAGLLVTELVRTTFLSLSFFLNIRTGTRARAMIYSLLYEKLSRLRNTGDKSIGEFVNLCASDAQRVYEGVSFSNFLVGGPIVILMAIIYTTYLIGPAALVGCGVFMLVYPIQVAVAKLAGKLRGTVVRITDSRVRLMSEMLNCIKLIKMYAWEESFTRSIIKKRNEERNALTKSSLLQGMNMSIALVVPTIATVATFSVHVATGQDLSTSQAFTVMTIFNVLIFSLAVLPFGVRAVAEAKIAIGRVKNLLEMEELQPFEDKPDDPNIVLAIEDADFAWDKVESEQNKEQENPEIGEENGAVAGNDTLKAKNKGGSKPPSGPRGRPPVTVKTRLVPTLFDIDLKVKKGKLIGICGSVGSGKSSILQCILAQMRKTRGRVAVGGSIAYVAQQAWMMNATARDNILLGLPFNEARYKSVCFACSLQTDFEILPNGDQTEIGERGINLSGGQKQRISLARALYAEKDLYLLDDPLSAVDAHVGQHIFKHFIKGALWGKTVIFATHQLQFLSQCDKVIYLKDGHIAERGSYNQLMRNNKEFATLIRLFLHEVEEELEEQAKMVANEDLTNFLERARSNSTWSSASAEEVMQIFNRQLSVRSMDESTDEGIDTFKYTPARSSTRSRATFEPFKRQVSTDSSLNADHQGGRAAKQPKEDDDVPKSREEAGKLTQAEDREEGSVRLSTYGKYFKAAGGFIVCFLVFLFFCAVLGVQTFIDSWLSFWLDSAARQNITSQEKSGIRSDDPENNYYIMVFCVSSLAFLLALFVKSYIFVKITLMASSKLHDRVFAKVMQATTSFFDVTPTGRILNRFSKDLDEIDAQLPWTLESFMQNLLRIIISIVLVAVMFPWFLIAVVPLFIVFFILNRFFRRSVRELKRLDGVTRSPIFTHLTATIQGLSTLHAFDKMADFNERFKALVDANTLPFFMYFASNRWLSVRLDMFTVIITTVTALLVVLTKGTLAPAFAGLALSYAIRITGLFQFTVRMAAETESRFTSVERMTSYIDSIPVEAPFEIEETKPPSDWPHTGAIVFNQVKMRYRPGLPLVLNNVTGYIYGNEKIGIVGRTGSGKSSLGIVLWRLVESAAGTIKIDDIDISTLGLRDLRSRISIIPQDPVLFIGTIRYNLDPFDKHSDEEVWTSLERAHLKDMVSNLPLKLLAPVVENGENFSVGERQLICMARALLRRSKILMLDEATAAIDSETDAKIQDTIHESFSNCTLLTIAHRLNTVLTADRIIVMDEGKIIEFDSPSMLSIDPDSQFSKLLQAANLQNEQSVQNARLLKQQNQQEINDVTSDNLPSNENIPINDVTSDNPPSNENIPINDVTSDNPPSNENIPIINVTSDNPPSNENIPIINVTSDNPPSNENIPINDVMSDNQPSNENIPINDVTSDNPPSNENIPINDVTSDNPPSNESIPINDVTSDNQPSKENIPINDVTPDNQPSNENIPINDVTSDNQPSNENIPSIDVTAPTADDEEEDDTQF